MASRQLDAYYDAHEGSIEELSRISLTESVDTEEGTLPSGAQGTVVSVYGSGDAYCVEFTRPFKALVTIAPSKVKALPEATRERLIADAASSGHRSK